MAAVLAGLSNTSYTKALGTVAGVLAIKIGALNLLTVRSRLITGDMASGKEGGKSQPADMNMNGFSVTFFKLSLCAVGPTCATQVYLAAINHPQICHLRCSSLSCGGCCRCSRTVCLHSLSEFPLPSAPGRNSCSSSTTPRRTSHGFWLWRPRSPSAATRPLGARRPSTSTARPALRTPSFSSPSSRKSSLASKCWSVQCPTLSGYSPCLACHPPRSREFESIGLRGRPGAVAGYKRRGTDYGVAARGREVDQRGARGVRRAPCRTITRRPKRKSCPHFYCVPDRNRTVCSVTGSLRSL